MAVDDSMPRWQEAQVLAVVRWGRRLAPSPRYVLDLMAAAMRGAMLPNRV